MHGWKKQNSAPQIKNIPKKNFRSHVNVLARFFSAPANGIYFAEKLPAAPPVCLYFDDFYQIVAKKTETN